MDATSSIIAAKDAREEERDPIAACAWRWALKAGWLTTAQVMEALAAGEAAAAARERRKAERD